MVTAYTRKVLDSLGLVVNRNMWIGDGWIYCKFCQKYTFHYAMSHKGKADCYEVCRECDNYTGKYSPVTKES